MKKLSILVLMTVLPALQIAQAREVIHKGDVVVAPITGEISPSLLAFVRRALKTAEASGASAIIFEMNTYGGRLDSAVEIARPLNQATSQPHTLLLSSPPTAAALRAH